MHSLRNNVSKTAKQMQVFVFKLCKQQFLKKKKSAFLQFCFPLEICQFESFFRIRKVLYDPPSPNPTALLVTPLERKEKKKSFCSFSPSSKKLVGFLMLQHISVFYHTSRLFFPCQNMQGKATQAPQLWGKGQPCSSYYLWMGKGRQTETLLMPQIFLDPTTALPRKSETQNAIGNIMGH